MVDKHTIALRESNSLFFSKALLNTLDSAMHLCSSLQMESGKISLFSDYMLLANLLQGVPTLCRSSMD